MDASFCNWLAGFVDGEGCFSLSAGSNGKSDLLFYKCVFSIALRDDDKRILEQIQETTGLGKVYFFAARGTSQPKATWAVSSKSDCLKLVELFDRYPLRAKKSRDYAIWREAVLLWTKQRHGVRETGPLQERDKFAALKTKLQAVRKYRPAA